MKNSILEKDKQYIWHPYTQQKTAAEPLAIIKGQEALLFDENGNEYIDGISSWWTNTHGHSNPYIAKKIYEQALELEHVIFAGFTHKPAVTLGERLLGKIPYQKRVFFSDNGSTAVEIAIKMAIQYFHNKGIQRKTLVAFENAFHGETFGAMSASGDLSLNNAFKEHLFNIIRIPEPIGEDKEKSFAALEEVLQNNQVYAFIFEPLLQGAGGMRMYAPEDLDKLIAICRKHEVLCIADEVMTGFYRTGKFFASDYLKNKPDLMCLSKGLTGGTLPLAITTCTEEIFEAFLSDDKLKTFFHGHSYTANPIGCAAALASLDLFEQDSTQQNIEWLVSNHANFLKKIKGHPKLNDVRQQGTVLAFEFKTSQNTSYFNNLRDKLYYYFLDRGAILRPLGNVIYLMPPYCITKKQLLKLYNLIEQILTEDFI